MFCFNFQLIFLFFIEKVNQLLSYSFIFIPWFILFPWIVKKTQLVSPYVSLNVISQIKIVINYLLFILIYSHFGNCRGPRERDFSYLQKNINKASITFPSSEDVDHRMAMLYYMFSVDHLILLLVFMFLLVHPLAATPCNS